MKTNFMKVVTSPNFNVLRMASEFLKKDVRIFKFVYSIQELEESVDYLSENLYTGQMCADEGLSAYWVMKILEDTFVDDHEMVLVHEFLKRLVYSRRKIRIVFHIISNSNIFYFYIITKEEGKRSNNQQ